MPDSQYTVLLDGSPNTNERATVKIPLSSQSVDIGDGLQTPTVSGIRSWFDDQNPGQLRYNFSANGTSPVVEWHGGNGIFSVLGDGGGGTYTLQKRLTGGSNWAAVGNDTTIAGSGEGAFASQHCDLRIVATGATTPSVETSIGYSQINM